MTEGQSFLNGRTALSREDAIELITKMDKYMLAFILEISRGEHVWKARQEMVKMKIENPVIWDRRNK